ncbi:alpha/beta hydrolase [Amycolatopsis aidingensis]|uniref:alpha/beta hydrolase n=1 Tax=Amycolatopsis aidingensis TaxID=2842453 RepID=UPI001C0E3892|nr:alpha/beta hydrolase family protein [Amycolatopsis aidingensis]
MSGLTVLADGASTGTVRELRLFSPAVGREVGVTLLTPPGWEPGGYAGYPVLYLLHGSSDDHHSLVRHTEIARLAENGNMLVAIPEAGRLGFYTDWRVPDRLGTVPRWETFHLGELLPLLEREYGASEVRMAAGLSMGGYGALRYGMRHPGMFRAVASLSGLMHLTRRGMAALLGLLSVREGMRPGLIWGPRRRCPEAWAANDPLVRADALRQTPVYLAAGDGSRRPGDQFVAGMGLVERYSRAMTEDLAERLCALGTEVTTRYTTGIHFWPTWRRMIEEFWPYAQDVLRD